MVNQFVDAHRAPRITKFGVFIDSKWSTDLSQVEKWTRFAFRKGVEELHLNFRSCRGYDRFSLGYNILKHSPASGIGIANLKSLRLSCVDIGGETLEFFLFQCRLLECLYVSDSNTLHTLNIVSCKLKHLTLLKCINLRELQIDAVNLITFHFEDGHKFTFTHIVFKSVPKLIGVDLAGERCLCPFPILDQISCLSKQLTKLSIGPSSDNHIYMPSCSDAAIGVLFPNVKQLSLIAVDFYDMFINFFMKECPMVHELKLQVIIRVYEEAERLQKIKLEDDENGKMSNSYFEAQKESLNKNKKSYPNLKVLEIVGFNGGDDDVYFARDIIACANSFQTFICNPLIPSYLGSFWEYENPKNLYTCKRRARKLATLLSPKIHVGFLEKSGVCWFS